MKLVDTCRTYRFIGQKEPNFFLLLQNRLGLHTFLLLKQKFVYESSPVSCCEIPGEMKILTKLQI